jgi:hypothetical protein
MNCSTVNCRTTALVHKPVPLCGTCALQVIAEYASANLGRRQPSKQNHSRNVAEETETLYRVLDAEGWNAINLARATQILHVPQRTAARRLSAARKQYATELARRANNSSDLDFFDATHPE